MFKRATFCTTSPEKIRNIRHILQSRNLAQPFPTPFTRTHNLMIKMRYFGACQFCRFRPYWPFMVLREMSGKEFRRLRMETPNGHSRRGEHAQVPTSLSPTITKTTCRDEPPAWGFTNILVKVSI
jgi:hypothetical protein